MRTRGRVNRYPLAVQGRGGLAKNAGRRGAPTPPKRLTRPSAAHRRPGRPESHPEARSGSQRPSAPSGGVFARWYPNGTQDWIALARSAIGMASVPEAGLGTQKPRKNKGESRLADGLAQPCLTHGWIVF